MPTTFANTINGNPIYASRAESDKDGNRIDTTYAKLSDIPPGVTVDQTYNASSTNAQSGTAVAEAISGVRQVPTTQSTDNGKVLGVTDTNGTLGWVAQSGGSGNMARVIPGLLHERASSSDLIDICVAIDQYSSTDDILLVKGTATVDYVDYNVVWRFIRVADFGDRRLYTFNVLVEDLFIYHMRVEYIYVGTPEEAHIFDTSVHNISEQTLQSGNCIGISGDEINWETTAGLTDIQQVAALPANPVSTVLYLIPAT